VSARRRRRRCRHRPRAPPASARLIPRLPHLRRGLPSQIERVLFARSGTLLVTWTEVHSAAANSSSSDSSTGGGGGILALRQRLRTAFPGASARQPQIIHSSLLRVLSPRQLDAATVKALSDEAERWTQKVRPASLQMASMGSLLRAARLGLGSGRPAAALRHPRSATKTASQPSAHPTNGNPQQMRGRRLRLEELWYCIEEEFSTIRGTREVLPLTSAANAALLN
jgi:hypothetical protein